MIDPDRFPCDRCDGDTVALHWVDEQPIAVCERCLDSETIRHFKVPAGRHGDAAPSGAREGS